MEHGVHIAELHHLEQLAADRRYEFCYLALLPKLRGITGGFAMRPIALTPSECGCQGLRVANPVAIIPTC
ncbi:MAG: hypothetical protein OXD34_12225 [bacterium]|nr:hypothetical protein [bacterium]